MSKLISLSDEFKNLFSSNRFNQTDLCADSVNPILLDDGQPVFKGMRIDDLVNMYDPKAWMVPDPEQIVRLGIYLELNYNMIVHLCVKSLLENTIRLQLVSRHDMEKAPAANLKKLMSGAVDSFRIAEMFNVIDSYGFNSAYGMNKKLFVKYVKDLDLNEVMQTGVADVPLRMINYSGEGKRTEEEMLAVADGAKVRDYQDAKAQWIRMNEQLKQSLLDIEQAKNIFYQNELKYYKKFGQLLVSLAEKKKEIAILVIMKEMHAENPDLTWEEAENLALEKYLSGENDYVRTLRLARLSTLTSPRTSGFHHLNDESADKFRSNYIEKIKKLLKELYMMLHPDSLSHDIDAKKREELHMLWVRLMQIRDEEGFQHPENLQFKLPAIEKLLELKKEACRILGTKYVDDSEGNVEDMMLKGLIESGLSIEEITKVLRAESEELTYACAQVELSMKAILGPQDQTWLDALRNPENEKERLTKEILSVSQKIEALRSEVKQLFES